MIVVGGSYREISSFPSKNVFYGSGLKASCAISSIVSGVEFYTAISEPEEAEARAIAAAYNVKASFVKRPAPIEFHYLTPLTTPRIFGLGQAVQISAKGENALVFGLLESDPEVEAKKIVYDPQRPKGPTLDRNKLKCDQLAVVLNKHEAKELTQISDPEQAAQKIRAAYNADVVVVKCGALGARVVDASGSAWIGAFPSKTVWPIGSGDIFSAIFAAAWLENKKTAVEAATLASKAVSTWVCSPDLLPIDSLTAGALSGALPEKIPLVYLAGPFFNLGQNWLVDNTRAALENLGAKVFSPLHDVGPGGDEVALPDLDGLDKSNSVLALLDEVDTGTVFEVGYALAKGIKVIGYSQNPEISQLKMIRGSGIPIFSDYSTAVYHSIWAGV